MKLLLLVCVPACLPACFPTMGLKVGHGSCSHHSHFGSFRFVSLHHCYWNARGAPCPQNSCNEFLALIDLNSFGTKACAPNCVGMVTKSMRLPFGNVQFVAQRVSQRASQVKVGVGAAFVSKIWSRYVTVVRSFRCVVLSRHLRCLPFYLPSGLPACFLAAWLPENLHGRVASFQFVFFDSPSAC